MKRFVRLGTVLCLFAICTGCGQTFRPIIIPNPPKFPNPAASHTIVTLSDNGTAVDGSAMVIDVSGDSEVSIKNLGLNPVHGLWQNATQMLAVNQSNATNPQDSVTKLAFSGTVIGSTIDDYLAALVRRFRQFDFCGAELRGHDRVDLCLCLDAEIPAPESKQHWRDDCSVRRRNQHATERH